MDDVKPNTAKHLTVFQLPYTVLTHFLFVYLFVCLFVAVVVFSIIVVIL